MNYFQSVSSAIGVPKGLEPGEPKTEASPGGVPKMSTGKQRLQLVFNPDLRKPVGDTRLSPVRAIADLMIDVGGPYPEYATGWFISPSVVITAAHALSYVDSSGSVVLAHRVRVIPGANGGSAPFGVFDSTTMRVAKDWIPQRDANNDYGAIHLDQPVGNAVGWFGCGLFTDEQIAGSQFNLIGYPTDKLPLGSMWGESGPASPGSELITYTMSSYPGQSGCPLFTLINGQPWVAGVHSGGQGSSNFAVRLTRDVLDELSSWRS